MAIAAREKHATRRLNQYAPWIMRTLKMRMCLIDYPANSRQLICNHQYLSGHARSGEAGVRHWPARAVPMDVFILCQRYTLADFD